MVETIAHANLLATVVGVATADRREKEHHNGEMQVDFTMWEGKEMIDGEMITGGIIAAVTKAATDMSGITIGEDGNMIDAIIAMTGTVSEEHLAQAERARLACTATGLKSTAQEQCQSRNCQRKNRFLSSVAICR